MGKHVKYNLFSIGQLIFIIISSFDADRKQCGGCEQWLTRNAYDQHQAGRCPGYASVTRTTERPEPRSVPGQQQQQPTEEDTDTAVGMQLGFLNKWQEHFNISDSAMEALLKGQQLMSAVAKMTGVTMGKLWPASLATLRKDVDPEETMFESRVVCTRCQSYYKAEDCYETTTTGVRKSKRCSALIGAKRTCGALLLRHRRAKNGDSFLAPKEVFAFRSIKDSLRDMFRRPGFADKCNEWKQQSDSDNRPADGVWTDIFDEKLFKDFLVVNGEDFLRGRHGLAFQLFVDWYQPFKHTQYSLGVMMLSILNLPRDQRYKKENVIISGFIPGPKEPSDMKPYLRPLVDDLEDLWEGIELEDDTGLHTYRGALLCLACDIPASRKCGGFLGHGATSGQLNNKPYLLGEFNDYFNADCTI